MKKRNEPKVKPGLRALPQGQWIGRRDAWGERQEAQFGTACVGGNYAAARLAVQRQRGIAGYRGVKPVLKARVFDKILANQ